MGAQPRVLLALLAVTHLSAVSGLLLPQEAREKRDRQCPPGKYQHPGNSSICCTMCHKGTYLFSHCPSEDQVTDCHECEPGTFTEFENHQRHCLSCSVCRTELKQVELSPCTGKSDTMCGCRKGQFRYYMGPKPFECRTCSPCLNGTVKIACQESQDTVCICDAGFFLSENECVPCGSCKEPHKCTKVCHPVTRPSQSQDSGTAVLLPLVVFLGFCFVGSLLLAFLCHHPRWKSKLHSIVCGAPGPVKEGELEGMSLKSPASAPIPEGFVPPQNFSVPPRDCSWHLSPPKEEAPPTYARVEAVQPVTSMPSSSWGDKAQAPCPDGAPLCPPAAPAGSEPAVLYAVVEGIPPTRFKELMRRLGLSPNHIELLDLQHGRSVREAHYSMLEAWCQQTPRPPAAMLDLLASVLGDMNLLGCLESIRETLRAQGRLP